MNATFKKIHQPFKTKLMLFEIIKNKETFSVFGTINNINALELKAFISLAMEDTNELIIDIENVIEIDSKGMSVLHSIYKDCLSKNKLIYIIGTGCKEVYDDLDMRNVA